MKALNAKVYFAFLALALSACEPETVRMELLAYDRAADSYGFRAVELQGLEDLGALDGRFARLYSSASVTLDYRDGMLRWNENPRTVAFAWYRDGDLVVPEDFDSFAMASIYYNVDQAASFFADLGVDDKTLGQIPVYYDPVFEVIEANGKADIWRDNAFFVAMSKESNAIFVLPFELFEWVPLALNVGVMTHEYTHAVFNELVLDVNPLLNAAASVATANFVSSINEGLADFMAVTLTGDPDYMNHSIPRGFFSSQASASLSDITRDASHFLIYTSSMDKAARTSFANEYDPYVMGAFFASYLYAVACALDDVAPPALPSLETLRAVASKAIETMAEIGGTSHDGFEMVDALSLFVQRYIGDPQKNLVCEVTNQRAQVLISQIKDC